MHDLHWKTGRQAARLICLAHKLKRTENVSKRNEMKETEKNSTVICAEIFFFSFDLLLLLRIVSTGWAKKPRQIFLAITLVNMDRF